jgi:hypothetical protein
LAINEHKILLEIFRKNGRPESLDHLLFEYLLVCSFSLVSFVISLPKRFC